MGLLDFFKRRIKIGGPPPLIIDTPGDDSGSEVLGIWTSHIALLFGRPLKAGDIQTIYPRAEQEGQR